MQTVPWIGGIAHPTGFPLYVILGWCFAHAVAFGSIAWRMSLFSSVAACATGGFVYAIVRGETRRTWLAVASAYLFDATSLVWSRGTRADVHPLAACFVAASVDAIFRFRRTRDARWFVASCGTFGAALAVHPVALFAAFALAAAAAPALRTISARRAALALGAFALPLLSYGAIPLRSAAIARARLDPTLALGIAPGAPFWDYGHTADPRNLLWYLSGAQFHREAGFFGYANATSLFAAFGSGAALALREYGIVALAIALVGFVVLTLRSPSRGSALGLLALAAAPFAFSYAEEADKERYLLFAFFATACLIGFGADALASLLERRFGTRMRVGDALVAIVLVGFVVARFYGNVNVIAIDRDVVARRFVDAVERATPIDAVVIADWTYATPLAYAAYAERSFGRRILVTAAIDERIVPSARRWSRDRCVAYASGSPALGPIGTKLHAVRRAGVGPYLFTIGSCGIGARETRAPD